MCGAVIINSSKLITCAHCLPEDNEMNITTQKIRAGSIIPNDGGEIRNVSRYIIHPDFEDTSDHNNDIAVLIIDPPLDLSTKMMKSIKIANPSEDANIYTTLGNEFIIAGYGPTESTNDDVNLRWLQQPLVDQDLCSKIYDNLPLPKVITNKMFCSGDELFKFTRDGDSGGN